MEFVFTLITSTPFLTLPDRWESWVIFAVLLLLLSSLLWRWRALNQPWRKDRVWLLVFLVALTPLAGCFFGIRLGTIIPAPVSQTLSIPSFPSSPPPQTILILLAVPGMLTAGVFGMVPAAGVALLTGIFHALWDNHNLYEPLVLTLLVTLFSAAIQQRYRTRLFQALRQPIIAALLVAIIYPLIYLFYAPFTIQGSLVNRLDYFISHLPLTSLATGLELIIASVFAQGAAIIVPHRWGGQSPMIASPAEKSLHTRFFYMMVPIALVLILILMIGDWWVADSAARQLLWSRMQSLSQMAAENIPYFLDTGQGLIKHLAANPAHYQASTDNQNYRATLTDLLGQEIRIVPFFTQLILLDPQGKLVATYGGDEYTGNQQPENEARGIELARNDIIPIQTYTIPPSSHGQMAQVSFIATIYDDQKNVRGILIGRTDLAENPYSRSIVNLLNSLPDIQGQGCLIDDTGRILVHTDPKQVMKIYQGGIYDQPNSYQDQAPNGTRQLVHFQPAIGISWSIVTVVPASQAQQLALQIAAPLLVTLVVLSIITLFLLRFGLGAVTADLSSLSQEASYIARGRLDLPMRVEGDDEVGRLRQALELMRRSLKARLDELNRLLTVSQGVASSLDIHEAIQPVLEAALVTGANSVRVVLSPSVMPELYGNPSIPLSFSAGSSKDLYSDLDEQILTLTRQQDRLVLTSLTRPRLISLKAISQNPASLMAVALRHEQFYYGVLWIAYDQPHSFTEEEVRFIVTLASQAALAAANTRLFMSAEIGRQRLAAIVDSTPDPVLVIDQQGHLLLANSAAVQMFGLNLEKDSAQPIDRVINQKELVELIRTSSSEKQSIEIILPFGQIYLATISPVLAEGQKVGRVCILRDVTRFKELDGLKSDFLNAVSHDLRSPLTQIRGYATMLDIVGPLNDQQTGYVRKIVAGVEDMSHLVSNLLDLNRIEAGIDLQLEMISLQDLIESVIVMLQPQATQKKIQIVNETYQPGLPAIEADLSLLQQALYNLVENAIKYNRPDGKVIIRCQTRPERIIIEVADNGIGISPVDLPRLFEKFNRGTQPGAKDPRGIGLGLAIVKSIVERHQGQVWAESQLGKGSTLYISIPVRQQKSEM